MEILFISDYVCPYCLVAKEALRQAMAETGITPDITWHPYELTPEPKPQVDTYHDEKRRAGYQRLVEPCRKLGLDMKLPPNVIGVLADCGYTSAKEIIQVVIRQMGLPPKLGYPFVKLGARLFGHFDPEADSPEEAMKRSSVPVIFFHGEDDAFVPCDMSRRCYAACASPKKRLVTIPGAGHGLCYPVAPEQYLEALREFF